MSRHYHRFKAVGAKESSVRDSIEMDSVKKLTLSLRGNTLINASFEVVSAISELELSF